ncbi:hypothetical protein NCC49_001282 [Naganishia albida]|nr:hypothetical protein NCC49_001282 [Naganishia albida]
MPFPRPTYLRLLTGIQNTSAIAFGTFLAVHLASPLVAAAAGGEAATNLMLLGRAYYHPLEPALVYGSVSLHLIASLLRRIHLAAASKTFRPTIHHLSGYVLVPFLTLHVMTHRLIPSRPDPPINALSPAELGYGFVSYGLRTWPRVSWTTYTLLIGTGLWHALAGAPRVLAWLRGVRTPPPPPPTAPTARKSRLVLPAAAAAAAAYVVLLSVLAAGLARLHHEEPGFSRGMRARVDAVYRTVGWVYR